MLPPTFYQPALFRSHQPRTTSANEQLISDKEPQGQSYGILALHLQQIIQYGADIDTYRVVADASDSIVSSVTAIKVARVAESDFDRKQTIHSLYSTLASEWCKLDGVHQHVFPGWVTEAKVAGIVVPVMAVPWYDNGDVLAYLQSAQDIRPIEFARQVASGLEYIHTAGVVHGNVYPGNVMITQARKVCLVDIGVRACINQYLYSESIPLSGAWRYKAPEDLAAGESYTKAADVYGFAGTVYAQMMTLTQPFESQTLGTGLQEIINEGHCRLLDQSDHTRMTVDLQNVLRECWSFKPAQRPGMKDIESRFQEL